MSVADEVAQYRNAYDKLTNAVNSDIRGADRQTISVTDLICEGPIYGLVDGPASVFLNNDRVMDLADASSYQQLGPLSVTLDNGSSTATINNSQGTNPILESTDGGSKFLIVRAGLGATTFTAVYKRPVRGQAYWELTTPTSFFTTAMYATQTTRYAAAFEGNPVRLFASDGTRVEGILQALTSGHSTTVAAFFPGSTYNTTGDVMPSAGSIQVDQPASISSISGTTLTLSTNWTTNPTGTPVQYDFDVSGSISVESSSVVNSTAPFDGVQTQFRVGRLHQAPLTGEGGVGSTAISNTPSAGGTLEYSTGYGGSQAPKELIGTAASGFNLTASQISQVDEIRFSIAYQGGHYAVSGKGNDKTTYTSYSYKLALKLVGANDFSDPIILNDRKTHVGMNKNAVSFTYTVDMNQFPPFTDFKLIVARVTDHEGPAYDNYSTTYHDWTQVTGASLNTTTAIIKERLSMPYTALAKVSFNTKQFQSTPTRSYHLRGKVVQVPSNYVTREEVGTQAATYNRSTSTGVVQSSYQDWDGDFREELVYTNNPAWVFYDLLLNERYGLGDFLTDTDIDKYALYRIGRYCDELVPDGKGGQEPRFTSNVFLGKQTDSFKVLKDMATTFSSMLYYIDGKVLPVLDAPAGPVYNFTKGNVIDGSFSYESTGSKTRINQVVVTWNNPEADYKLEPVLVEDRLNIAKTGKILSQDAVAFGCTSEGQAIRYGRWKLWTAANQKEIASFVTGINGAFLTPGDIVNIQDADRNAVRYSGRVSSSSTPSTTVVPIDAPLTLNANSSYELSILLVEPAAFVAQTTSVTISSVVYNKGDLVPSIATETASVNAVDDSGDPVLMSWSNYTRVETQTVSTSAGSDISSLTVDTAFTSAPDSSSIWVLSETDNTGQVVASSAKEYKILAISEQTPSTYAITAVEHYDEKFSSVDQEFSTYTYQTVKPDVSATSVVPSTSDVYSVAMSSEEKAGEELTVFWTAPASTGVSTTVNDQTVVSGGNGPRYEFLQGYEISHDFPNVETPILVDKDQGSYSFEGIPDGSYTVVLRVLNTLGNRSKPVATSVTVTDRFNTNIPRLAEGLPHGGSTNVSLTSTSSGTVQFADPSYTLNQLDASSSIVNTSIVPSAYKQDASTMSSGTNAYVLVSSADATDRLKLVKYVTTDASGVRYYYDAGTGNSSAFSSNLTGTISKTTNNAKVTGSGTSFLTELYIGAIVRVAGVIVGKVGHIQNDTVLFLDRSISTSFSGTAYNTTNIQIDYANDMVVGEVQKNASGVYSLSPLASLDVSSSPVPVFPKSSGEKYFPLNSVVNGQANNTLGAGSAAVVGSSYSVSSDSVTGNSLVNDDGILLLDHATASTIEAGGFTYALWFKSTTTSGDNEGTLISRDRSDYWGLEVDQSTSSPQAVKIWVQGIGDNVTIAQAVVNQWNHIAISYDGTYMKAFLNGQEVYNATGYNPLTTTRIVGVGANSEDIMSTSNKFTGNFTEIRVYGEALGNTEVSALYTYPAASGNAGISDTPLQLGDVSGSGSIFKVTDEGLQLGNSVFASAPFSVAMDGSLVASSAVISGNITATTGAIGGWTVDTDSIFSGTKDVAGYTSTGITISSASDGSIHAKEFYIDTSGSAFFKGELSAATGTFSGDISAASGTFTGDIEIGSGESVFKADSAGIYLGNETFASAEFSVTPAGALKATSAIITGEITANNLSSLNGQPVEALNLNTKLKSQSALSPRVVMRGSNSAVSYAVLENGTNIYRNNEIIVTNASAGDNFTFAETGALAAGDILHSNRPVAFKAAGYSLPSLCSTGRQFTASSSRGTSQFFTVYTPYNSGRIKYFVSTSTNPQKSAGGSLIDWSDTNAYDASTNTEGWLSASLTAKAVTTITATVTESTNYRYWFLSDTSVVITHHNTTTTDAKTLKFATNELLGFRGGDVTLFSPDGAETPVTQTTSNWTYYKVFNNLIGQAQEGDGAGSDGTAGIPWDMCGDTYLVDHVMENYQIGTIESSIISVYYFNEGADENTPGTWTLYKTHDLSAGSRTNLVGLEEGSTNYEGGDALAVGKSPWKFIGTGRFALRTNDTLGKEYFVLGYDSNLRSQPEIRAGKLIAADISAEAVNSTHIQSRTIIAENIQVGALQGDELNITSRIKVGSNALTSALDGLDSNIRIYAGAANGGTAPFRVDTTGRVYADSIVIANENGVFFDTNGGFGDAALTQIANFLSTRVYSFSEAFSADLNTSDTSTYEEIIFTDTSTVVSTTLKLPVSSFSKTITREHFGYYDYPFVFYTHASYTQGVAWENEDLNRPQETPDIATGEYSLDRPLQIGEYVRMSINSMPSGSSISNLVGAEVVYRDPSTNNITVYTGSFPMAIGSGTYLFQSEVRFRIINTSEFSYTMVNGNSATYNQTFKAGGASATVASNATPNTAALAYASVPTQVRVKLQRRDTLGGAVAAYLIGGATTYATFNKTDNSAANTTNSQYRVAVTFNSTSFWELSSSVGIDLGTGAVDAQGFISDTGVQETLSGSLTGESYFYDSTMLVTLGTDTSITIGNRLFTVSVPTTSSGFLLEGGSASQDAGELTISSFTNATIQNDSESFVDSNAILMTAAAVDDRINSNISTALGSVDNLTLTGYLRGPSSFVIDPATHDDDTGTVIIAGNLQVDGLTTTINSTTVNIDDKTLVIAADAANASAANGAGLQVNGANASISYLSTSDSWVSNKSLSIKGFTYLDAETDTTTATTQTAIASFTHAMYSGAKIIITATSGGERHICELLITHDGTTAISTQYGSVTTAGDLATFEVDISGTDVRILATSASTTSTVYKVSKQLLT